MKVVILKFINKSLNDCLSKIEILIFHFLIIMSPLKQRKKTMIMNFIEFTKNTVLFNKID